MATGNMTISELSSVMMNAKMQSGMIQTHTNELGGFQSFLGQSQNLDSQPNDKVNKIVPNDKLQDVVDKNTSNKTKDIIKKINTSENHADEKVCENVSNGIKEIIKENLGISDEELEKAMAELGFTFADLLVPQNVSNLLAQIKDIEPAMIITDAELTNNLTEIINEITQLVNETAQNIQIPVEQLVEEFENQINGENSNDSDNLDNVQTVKTVIDESTGKQITVTLEDNRVKDTSTEYVKSDESVNAEVVTGKDVTNDSNTSKKQFSDNSEQAFSSNLLNNLTESLTDSIDATSTFSETYGVSTADVVNQLIDSIRLNVNVDTTTMEIQLTPENLGKINLSVAASKDGIITATITAQNEAVKAVIEGQLIQLKEALNNQGLKVTDVEVTIAGQAFDRNAENDNGNGNGTQKHRSNRRFRGIDEISGDGIETVDETILEQMMEADGNSLNLKA